MQTVSKTSPFIRKATSTKRMMIDVLIALTPAFLFATYVYKFDFFLKALVASIVAVGLEALSFGLAKDKEETWKERFEKKYTINHIIPPIISAIIFVMIIPSNLPYLIVIIGIAFAIVIGKMIFGGLGRNIFNPAGLGRVFVGLAFASFFSSYTGVDGLTGTTALGMSFPEVLNHYSLFDLFFGVIPGSMGEINSFAILLGAAYLIYRRAGDFRVILTSILTFSLFMLFAGLAQNLGFTLLIKYVLFHLLSGGFLFGIVFMATDPVTSPYTGPGRLIYSLIISSLVALIRLFGALPEGMVFALLVANFFVPLIDYKRWTNSVYTKRFVLGYSISVLVIALIMFFGMGGF